MLLFQDNSPLIQLNLELYQLQWCCNDELSLGQASKPTNNRRSHPSQVQIESQSEKNWPWGQKQISHKTNSSLTPTPTTPTPTTSTTQPQRCQSKKNFNPINGLHFFHSLRSLSEARQCHLPHLKNRRKRNKVEQRIFFQWISFQIKKRGKRKDWIENDIERKKRVWFWLWHPLRSFLRRPFSGNPLVRFPLLWLKFNSCNYLQYPKALGKKWVRFGLRAKLLKSSNGK